MDTFVERRVSISTEPRRARSRLAQSFHHAFDGLLHAVSQPNMKIHVVSGALVGLVGSGIPLGLAEKVTLLFCVMLIFFAEILNTALESLVDLHTQDFRDLARITKDTAAAGVLVLSAGTILLFATILVYNAETIASHGPAIARQCLLGLPFASVVALLLRERPRRAAADHALLGVGLALLGVLLRASESLVWSGVDLLLLLLAWRWARVERGQAMRISRP